MYNELIILRGLDKRVLGVKKEHVLYLTEGELNNELHTNIHFMNGHFVTASLPLNQVKAVLEAESEKNSDEQINKWKLQAKTSMEMDAKRDEVRKLMAEQFAGYTQKSWSTQKDQDGTLTVCAVLMPTKETMTSEEQKILDKLDMAAKLADTEDDHIFTPPEN